MASELSAQQPEREAQPDWRVEAKELASEALEEFVFNEGLSDIVEKFDPTIDGLKDTDERLDRLIKVAGAHFDFRRDKLTDEPQERQNVGSKAEFDNPDSDIWKTIFEGANKLGMVESTFPKHKDHNLKVYLGGAKLSSFYRVQFGMPYPADMEVFLGSQRAVGEKEAKIVQAYAPNAKTEFDLGTAAFTTLYDIQPTDGNDELNIATPDWHIKHLMKEDGTPLFVLSAPPSPNRKRASTGDTYVLLRRIAQDELAPGERVLVVTNAFYKPFQHFDAIREITLKTGAEVETIGFDAAYGGTERLASQLLQEIKSAIDAAAKLRTAIKTE